MSRETPDASRELPAPNCEPRDASRERQDICAEVETALADLRRLNARYQQVQQDSAAIQSKIAAIRAEQLLARDRDAPPNEAPLGGGGLTAPSDRTPRARARAVPAFVRTATLGVNVSGYLDTESGMGEAARASIRSLEAVGVPVALNNVSSKLRTRDTSYTGRFGETNPHPFNLVHLNADNMGWFADGRGRAYFRNRYTIGYWFWELAAFREEWVPFFDYVDEVWAASDFVRESFAAWSPVPVVRMPLPVVLPPCRPSGAPISTCPPAERSFSTCSTSRARPSGRTPAGRSTPSAARGSTQDEAVLVLKFTNAEYDREAVRALHVLADGLHVRFLDGYMQREEICRTARDR